MTQLGYMLWDGIEISNTQRTKAYAERLGLGWYRGCSDCDIAQALGHPAYTTPSGDAATSSFKGGWYDPAALISDGFAGFVVTEVENLLGSTFTAAVTENLTLGGTVSTKRFNHREVVVRGFLLGVDASACAWGLDWLTQTLIYGDVCGVAPGGGGKCTEAALKWYEECPDVCGDPWHPAVTATAGVLDCPSNLQRRLIDCSVLQAPQVTSQTAVGSGWCGGHIMEVEFIVASESPYVWWNPATLAPVSWGAARSLPVSDPPAAARAGSGRAVRPDQACIYDPACPAVMAPGYTQNLAGCSTPPTNWDRTTVPLSSAAVPTFMRAVPKFALTNNASTDSGYVRVTLVKRGDDPDTQWMNQLLIRNVPPGGVFTWDGPRDRAKLRCQNYTSLANHLVTVSSAYDYRGRSTDLQTAITCGDAVDVVFDRDAAWAGKNLTIDLDLWLRMF